MMFLGERGYRVIAHDRRGHGRSDQTWHGNDMDTYADDLAELIETLDLHDAVLVGHSTGGGEVARYIGRHGTGRVAKAVLLGAVPPLMLKSEANPDGTPIEVFDGIRAGVLSDRSQFFKDLTLPFYGYNREGAKISEGIRAKPTYPSRHNHSPNRHYSLANGTPRPLRAPESLHRRSLDSSSRLSRFARSSGITSRPCRCGRSTAAPAGHP